MLLDNSNNTKSSVYILLYGLQQGTLRKRRLIEVSEEKAQHLCHIRISTVCSAESRTQTCTGGRYMLN